MTPYDSDDTAGGFVNLMTKPPEERVIESDGILFHNPTTVNVGILHEKPEHRIILFLKAQGFSNREICQQTGYTDAWVSQILRQPWARERLATIIHSAGEDIVQTVLRGEALNSVFTLIDVRDSAPKASDKIAAANSLLDRFLGKPTQKIESEVTHKKAALTGEELDRQIMDLEAEEERLLGQRAQRVDTNTNSISA